MPNVKSAKKELRKSQKRQAYNKKIKDNLKQLVKRSQKAIVAQDKEADSLVQKSLKALDKAAQKGVIDKNARDRKKSRLHNKFNQAQKK